MSKAVLGESSKQFIKPMNPFFGGSNHFFQAPSEVILREEKPDCKDTSTHAFERAIKKDNMIKIANRLKANRRSFFKGRPKVYADAMAAKYRGGKTGIREGECVKFDKQWQDPNIGSLTNITATHELKTKIIATIYGEQAQNIPKQHKYIWLSMKVRIMSHEEPSEFLPKTGKAVLRQGAYHVFTRNDPNYKKAKAYMLKYYKDGAKPDPKKFPEFRDTPNFNPDVVDSIKKLVESDWNDSVLSDSSMYYFHWTNKKSKSPKLFECWADEKEGLKKKLSEAANTKEKKRLIQDLIDQCGKKNYQNLVTKGKWPKGLKLKKTIIPKPVDFSNPKPPVRTMYIFK